MATTSARRESVFRSPAFTRFYLGQALSYVGDGLRTLAIPLLVFKLTGSALSLGVTFALEIVPFALFSLVGGSLADRIARRRLMLTCDAIRFTIMVLFTIAYATGMLSLPLLYTGVVLLAISGAIFLGSQSSSIPYLLGKDRAKAAVSTLIATEQSVNLIAPPVGGAMFALLGPLPALAINALTYLTSQMSIASVADFGPERPSGMPNASEIVADIVAGWRFLTSDVALRSLTFAQLVMNMFGILGFVAVIPYLKREFGASDAIVGLTFGAFALGAVAGSVIGGKTHWPFGRALIISYLIDSIAWSPTIWTHSLPVAIAAMSISSACGTFSVTSLIAWRMRIIPEDMIGRVFGVIRLFVLIGMLPGSLLGGWIADRYGVRMDMLISSVGYAAVAFALITMKSLRADRR
jgi:MFS family permease